MKIFRMLCAQLVLIAAVGVPTWAQGATTLSVITFYADQNSRDIADYAAAKIKEKFPNVTLSFENLPSDGGQSMKTRAATRNLPDLITVNSGSIAVLSKSNNIIPLDSYYDRFAYRDKLQTAIVDSFLRSPDGHIYEFPTGGISPILWYYNKKLFDANHVKVPTNYNELLAAVAAFKARGIIPLALFGKEPWPLGAFFDSFALKENPAGIFALSNGDAKASDPTYSRAISKMDRLIKAGLFQAGATTTDYDSASALFTSGKAAMFINGSWYLADAAKLGADAGVFTTYPTADAGKEDQNRFAMAGGGDTEGVAVSADTKDKDLAAEVASLFAYNREVAEYQQQALITAPIKKSGLTLAQPLNPLSQRVLDDLEKMSYHSKFMHTLPNTEFAATLTEEIQKLIVGESMAAFVANVDKSIAKTTKK